MTTYSIFTTIFAVVIALCGMPAVIVVNGQVVDSLDTSSSSNSRSVADVVEVDREDVREDEEMDDLPVDTEKTNGSVPVVTTDAPVQVPLTATYKPYFNNKVNITTVMTVGPPRTELSRDDNTTTTNSTTADTTDDTTDTTEEEDCPSISQIVCSLRSFSMLCSLLEENALLDDLDDGLWTVFAPTNDAFNNALPICDDITNVLLGHTISNELIMYDDLVCTEKIEMTNGKYTRTVCGSGNTAGKTYQNGRGNDDNQRPEIIDYNSAACNGIIHVVSEVILP